MNQLQLFAIRAIVGLVFAIMITRFFRPEAGVPYMIGLWVILVGLAYFTGYLRDRKEK
ncbi:hypothetical protein D3OALGA1CA_141 [Olavius algarvensis associated proteobacterium Delta 3]|nr:hypothetical protein D3OALGA1CA_141 [Olavius algarvensis associated proteobacterium Delta 3]